MNNRLGMEQDLNCQLFFVMEQLALPLPELQPLQAGICWSVSQLITHLLFLLAVVQGGRGVLSGRRCGDAVLVTAILLQQPAV